MIWKRIPASRRKRFRFFMFPVVASNTRRLIFVKPETAVSMSPVGSESLNGCCTIKNLASFEIVAKTN